MSVSVTRGKGILISPLHPEGVRHLSDVALLYSASSRLSRASPSMSSLRSVRSAGYQGDISYTPSCALRACTGLFALKFVAKIHFFDVRKIRLITNNLPLKLPKLAKKTSFVIFFSYICRFNFFKTQPAYEKIA